MCCGRWREQKLCSICNANNFMSPAMRAVFRFGTEMARRGAKKMSSRISGVRRYVALVCLVARNIWRIYTRGRKPRIILKNDSFVTIVGPGARKFLNVINLKPSGLLANSTSADSATCFSQQIRAAWLTYRRTGARLIRQFGAETPEGTALPQASGRYVDNRCIPIHFVRKHESIAISVGAPQWVGPTWGVTTWWLRRWVFTELVRGSLARTWFVA